jgi:SET domain-containing protein
VTAPRIGLRQITGRGRGVVALIACAAGTELERSPVILVARRDVPVREGALTAFDEYLLYWSDTPDEELAMGGGLLMFYNHDAPGNVELATGPDPLTMSVFATRDIEPGEELGYDYGVPLWFTPSP